MSRVTMAAMDKSYYAVHSENLVEVLYERGKYGRGADGTVSMLCSRVTAKNRFYTDSNDSFFVENKGNIDIENISDDEISLYPNQRRLRTSIIENKQKDKQKLCTEGSQAINDVLKDIGLVCSSNSMKMYTMHPSKIFYYTHNITSYNPHRSQYSPILDQPLNDNDKYNNNNIYSGLNFSKLSPDRIIYNGVNENQKPVNLKRNKYSPIKYSRMNRERMKLPNKYTKYWNMRYMLFSKFDHGILLDNESFYSVCPEILSYHIAKRCKQYIAMDPFCGAGGNIIQLALTCDLVIAIDIDPKKVQNAKHNAGIYGVADKIEFIVGDFFTVSSMLKADVIFMSPPWGGPEYTATESFNIESMCENHYGGGFGIFNIVKKIAPRIAFHMPKTTLIYECLWLAIDYKRVEIQQNIINDKLNSITAFYGDFIDLTDNEY